MQRVNAEKWTTRAGGRDLLIGGLGRDDLHSNKDEDILIGGVLAYDEYLNAFGQVMDEWSRADSFDSRRNKLSTAPLNLLTHVEDDNAFDELHSGSDADWFLANFDASKGASGTLDKIEGFKVGKDWKDDI